MPSLDDQQTLVNKDLLALLRDAYVEGFVDRGLAGYDKDHPNQSLDSAWLKSNTLIEFLNNRSRNVKA